MLVGSWLSSPLSDPLFWPTLKVVGGILGAALVVLLVKEWRYRRELHRRELFKRLFTWAVIAPVYTLAVLGGRLPVLLLVSLMVFQGLREYGKLAGLPRLYRYVLIGMGLMASPAALHSRLAFYALPALLLLLATLQPLLAPNIKGGVRHLAFATLGWAYGAWLLGHFTLLYLYVPGSVSLLLVLMAGVALSDVAAFTMGKSLGRHKLAPAISPNKTWEGVVGNFVGACLGVGIMYAALGLKLGIPLALALSAIIAVGAVWGDLLESAIKREFQAKDAGDWLPGFGGLLDRVDSLIVAAPLVFYLMQLA